LKKSIIGKNKMDIIDISNSKYFFEIDTAKPVYGLILPLHNKFYILDNDYETLKFIQFLIIKHEWFSMTNFNSLQDHFEINNANCRNYGCDDTTAKLVIDYDIYPKFISLQKDSNFFNFELQEKLFYIKKVLVTTKKIIEENINDTTFQDRQNNLIMTEKFFNLLSSNDENIKEILSTEQQILNTVKVFNEKLLQYVLDILYSIDLKNLHLNEIKKNLEYYLDKTFKKTYYKDSEKILKRIID